MRTRTVIYIFLLTMNISFCQYRNYAGQPYSQPDILIWENDTIQIQTFPLTCWTKFDQNILFGNKKVKPDCWGCLKNYTAEWKIINSKLYLSNIYSFNYKKDSIKTDLNKLFPKKIKNNLILADWYSGNYYKSKYTQDTKYLVAYIDKHLDEKTKSILKRKKISIIFKTGKSKNNFSISIKGLNDKIVEDKLIETLKTLPEFDYYFRHGEELNLIFSIVYMDNRN